jgi:hypothetical protein
MADFETFANVADGTFVLEDQLHKLSIQDVQLILQGGDFSSDDDVLVMGGTDDTLTGITAEIADSAFGSSATMPMGGSDKSIIVRGHWLPGETGRSAWHPPLDIFQIAVAQQACQLCSNTFNELSGRRRISFQVQNLDLLSISSGCRFRCGGDKPEDERIVWTALNNDGVEGKVTKIFKILNKNRVHGSDGPNKKLNLVLVLHSVRMIEVATVEPTAPIPLPPSSFPAHCPLTTPSCPHSGPCGAAALHSMIPVAGTSP